MASACRKGRNRRIPTLDWCDCFFVSWAPLATPILLAHIAYSFRLPSESNNIATMNEPLESPGMADFVANPDRVNALAENSPVSCGACRLKPCKC